MWRGVRVLIPRMLLLRVVGVVRRVLLLVVVRSLLRVLVGIVSVAPSVLTRCSTSTRDILVLD